MSKHFLLTVIVLLVAFAGFQQYIIEGYDVVTQNLLDLADKLLALKFGGMK